MKPMLSKTQTLSFACIILLLLVSACTMPTVQTESDSNTDTMAGTEENAEDTANEEDAAESSAESDQASSDMTAFIIDPDQSQARFYIDEELRGNPVTVEGITSSLNGEIQIDPANPTGAQIGMITIDAASFVTDSDRRNGAIRRFVLSTNSYPDITFVTTAVDGLPDSATPGDTIELQITGELTLKDQSRTEIFAATITVESESQISGTASTTIQYADYGIFIPDVPFVANVSDDLILEFDFVANQ